MLNALAEGAVDSARDTHGIKGRKQGDPSAGWVVVDFGNVILHVFAPEQRGYYNLEELWREGKTLVKLQ